MLYFSRSLVAKIQLKQRRYRTSTRRWTHRLVSLFVALCLLSSTTVAAPRAIADVSQQWHADVAFWLKANDLIPKLWNFITQQKANPKQNEPQSARDARVSRIQIFPGDVTVEEGQQVNFTAVAYDAQNSPVGGVKFDWTTQDEDQRRDPAQAPRGLFVARGRGNYKITVAGAGRTATVKVKVNPGRRPREDEQPAEVKSVSTRDLPPEAMAKLKKGKPDSKPDSKEQKQAAPAREVTARASDTKLAHAAPRANTAAAAPFYLDNGWGDSNYWSADDPNNTVGNPPAAPDRWRRG
jgi:hypothetical protein